MSKLELNKYTDREIVSGVFDLPAHKFMSVMNAMAAITQRLETRGKLIAQDKSNENVDKMLRDLFENGE